MASSEGKVKVVEALLAAGADCEAKDKVKASPRPYAPIRNIFFGGWALGRRVSKKIISRHRVSGEFLGRWMARWVAGPP